MNTNNYALVAKLVPGNYVRLAGEAQNSRENLIATVLNHKKLPDEGWSDEMIEYFLSELSRMDSNNFLNNAGVGEREARIASKLVARRHYNFGHGIGRSGDLTEPQPKAVGSSLLQTLTNHFLEDLFIALGMENSIKCLLVPVATSMALVLTMLSFKQSRPDARYVLWSRIDQKACFKSMITAGFTPVIIDTIVAGEQLVTDIPDFQLNIAKLEPNNIVCILSTTSCFAPRACDNILELSKLAQKYGIPHLINNAYGLQDTSILKKIQKANRNGRVDVFIQSTDKNLMVPVGGAIISSYYEKNLVQISSTYSGRASSSPIIDVFITLLSLGRSGYIKLVNDRKQMYKKLIQELKLTTEEFGETVLKTPENPISIAITLKNIPKESLTRLGSMLFTRNVSGTRVITTEDCKSIGEYKFSGWGSHCNNFHTPYLTAAASIGMREEDITIFIKRLRKCLKEVINNSN